VLLVKTTATKLGKFLFDNVHHVIPNIMCPEFTLSLILLVHVYYGISKLIKPYRQTPNQSYEGLNRTGPQRIAR
jgi:hypothetical protein